MSRVKLSDLKLKVEALNELTGEKFIIDKNHLGYKIYLNGWDNIISNQRQTKRQTWYSIDNFINGIIWNMCDEKNKGEK